MIGGCFVMEKFAGNELLLALPLLAPAAYVYLYVWLRAFGKLCVNAAGFHAGNVEFGRWVAVSALRLFGFYQGLMRVESSFRRRCRGGGRKKRDQSVSEVVVELVPLA